MAGEESESLLVFPEMLANITVSSMSIRLFTGHTDETVVSLSKAIEAIEAESHREGNFVGFANDLDETLQFIRVEQDEWLVDVPVYVEKNTRITR